MKIALCQANFIIGDISSNREKILAFIRQAHSEGADLAVFPELSICGYPPMDLLEFDEFIDASIHAIHEIASYCTDIAALVGGPAVNPKKEGKNLFNSAYFLQNGKVRDVIHKTLLPNYDVFDEYRYFEPNRSFHCVEFMGQKLAVVICEDTWDIGEDPLYICWPMEELAKESPDIMINLSASPFSHKHPASRKAMLEWNTRRYGIPAVYVNQAGAHTELIFDGGSMVYSTQGELLLEMASFTEELAVVDMHQLPVPPAVFPVRTKEENIHDAIVCGIRDYFGKMGFSKAILGLSGGIDSAVTAVLACEALGAENVTGILMPSQFSSDHSIADARQLAENLQIPYEIIPITRIYDVFDTELQPFYRGIPPDVTEENIQARSRAVILMALANKWRSILLNTSNKSEAAVGYGTLYGDMCGGIGVLGDVYKTEVYALTRYINRDREIIPVNTIVKPPSAELRPNQKDADSLPEYEVLDQILFQYIECRAGSREIIGMGFDEALVKKVLHMVNTNEHKRYQAPPVLRVSGKAFGPGRRMPIVSRFVL